MTKIRLFLAHLLHALSCLSLRSKHTWVFIGWRRTENGEVFTDNTKYLYLYILKNHRSLKVIWLAKSRQVAKEMNEAGLPSYYEKSLAGIFYALCAGVTVLDAFLPEFNYRFIGTSKIVQLLHGKGMKAGGYSTLPFKKNDFIFTPSTFVEEILSDTFKADASLFVTGYPRSDGVLGCDYERPLHVNTKDEVFLAEARKQNRTTILYAPTFRRGQTEVDLNSTLDLKNLNAFLHDIDAHFFVSLHTKYRSLHISNEFDRVHILSPQDFFPLYKYIDILITDYSSVFTDFLLLDRPIIFYPYDFEEYVASEGVLIDYDTITPGPKAKNPTELVAVIKAVIANDTFKQEREVILNQYHTYNDNKSSERIIEILIKELRLKA